MAQAKKTTSRQGVVISKSGDKSIRVQIDYTIRHPKYGKTIKRRTRLGVHDQKNQAGVGDIVEIVQCRPISRTKSWRLINVIKKAAIE